MKKKFIYPLVVVLFLGAAGFIVFRYNSHRSKPVFYELLERKGPMASGAEWAEVRSTVENLSRAVRENPGDKKSALNLATVFIREARVTGNYNYYDMAALNQINRVLEQEPENFEALTYKALIYLSQHHFSEGLAIALQAQRINPYNAFIYGILTDAYVELGKYQEAINAADKMVSIRPDLRSYSRISYLREIHGDYPGAIEAMKLAVESGVTGEEGTEWTRVQLGHLYENTGDLRQAEMQYATSANARPGYAPALAGLGRVAKARKDYARAIEYFLQCDSLQKDYTYKEELSDLYQLTGDTQKANALAQEVVKEMTQEASAANSDPAAGHYVDKELAYAYLRINNTDKALEHALAEYNRRPDNIDVNETLAWVYYKRNQYKEAQHYIQKALRTHSKNPVLLERARMIGEMIDGRW